MSEIVLNTTTAGLQHQPSVAAFRGTHCLAVWADNSDATIKGRTFFVAGKNLGDQFIVNASTPEETNTSRQLPTVANAGPSIVVAWIESALNTPGPRPRVKLQRFDDSARKIGPEVQVSTSDVDPTHRPSITNMVDGGFVVTWVDARPDQRIRAQRFDGFDGSRIGSEFVVNTTEGFHQGPISCTLTDGNYVIAWRTDPAAVTGGRIAFRIFDLQGAPIGEEIKPNLSGFGVGKEMTALDNGRFVLAHVRDIGVSDLGVTKSIVEASVFEPSGASSNIQLPVSSAQGINCISPAVDGLPGGRLLIAWGQQSAETFDTDRKVCAKIFSDDLGPLGSEIQVNTTTVGDRSGVCATTIFGGDAGDNAFIAWTDKNGTNDDLSVRGRALRIDSSGLQI